MDAVREERVLPLPDDEGHGERSRETQQNMTLRKLLVAVKRIPHNFLEAALWTSAQVRRAALSRQELSSRCS